MNQNFIDYLEEINYSLMFSDSEEQYELYYLINEEGLTADMLEALCTVVFGQLNTFLRRKGAIKEDINPIVTTVIGSNNKVNAILLIKSDELGEVKIVDSVDFQNLAKYVRKNGFMINYYIKGMPENSDGHKIDLRVYKELAGTKIAILDYLENQFEYLGLQLARKRNKEV